MTIGSFGSRLVFEVSGEKIFTPQGVQRENKARYEEHQVLGSKPRLEYLAPELQSFSFSIQLNAAHGVNPARSLKTIQELVEKGLAERLILGGVNHGYFVIESAAEDWRYALPDGRIINASVSLTLKEYIK